MNNFIKATNNPHLKVLNINFEQLAFHYIEQVKKQLNINIVDLLDIGGGRGWGKCLFNRKDVNYHALDLNQQTNSGNITFVQGDITDSGLNLNKKFHIIFTKDTFEHILNPWDATDNIINHLHENGYFIFLAPFSWRYHSSPFDTYRYTHTGATYMFCRNNKLKPITACYKQCGNTKGFWKNKKDWTIDNQPFPKSIEVIFVGQKEEKFVFNSKTMLDIDLSPKHII